MDLASNMRIALRRLAKAVVVITCRHENQRFAMSATAVSELSMDPPSLLICVNRTASIHAPLLDGAGFCVNILHSSHETISALCSGKAKGEARFAQGAWAEGVNAMPYLRDAQAVFFCAADQWFSYGTHDIFIGRLLDVLSHGEVDPLVYVDGRYTTVASSGPVAAQ